MAQSVVLDNQKEEKAASSGFKMPEGIKAFLEELGGYGEFAGKFLATFWRPPYEFPEVIKQFFMVGNQSLGLVGITGFIMGLVLTLQSKPTLADFGAESMAPAMVSISIIREIGPVITAIICAGKIASGMGAELGSMRATEQIDAMEVSATNPFKFLVVTRVLATTLMIPLLVVYADAVALLGGWLGDNIGDYISFRMYYNQSIHALSFSDFLPAFVKTFFFGFVIGIIGCYKGFYSKNGTEGVGAAANSAVVAASLSVFIIDMVAVQIVTLLY